MHNDTTAPIIIPPPGPHTATVIWLHGLGADGHDFEPIVADLRLPATHGIKFVFPHAPFRPVSVNNGFVMRAWYDIRSPQINQIEDPDGILASADYLSRLLAVERAAGVEPARLVLAGFSQGGAMALHCGLRVAEPLGFILALSTYLPLSDRIGHERVEATTQTPVFMAHGQGDPVIPIATARRSAELLRSLGYSVDWQEYLMGHSLCDEEIDAIAVYFRRLLS